ncbi:hypothetical protein BU15DRAFT_76447 [Melanogaster broomeanus]|nr:hypothetical protein BU15DRAFT_76447 [Melanogaster broomeanus]
MLQRICTDVNIFKKEHLDVITRCADALFDQVTTAGVEFSNDSELVLELMDDKGGDMWRFGYYFVDHTHQCLFWVHDFQAESMFGNIKGVKSPSHIKTITSDTSLAPFDGEELGKMLELTKDLEGSVGRHDPHAMVVLARFARMFARTKFFSFCGQLGARLDVDQTVYADRDERHSVFLRCISPFLFRAPEIYAHGLKTIWIDKLVNHVSWKRFIAKLNSEWQEFTLYGTVVLNANVAFLAVPNMSSAARTSSYVSMACSVGTVILGLLLVRQNRSKSRDSAEEAVYFMTRMTSSMFGSETLAVLYSTPFSLLMWGMIFFVVAFCFLVFQGPSETTQAPVASAVAVVGVLVFWTVWSAWDPTPAANRPAMIHTRKATKL